MERQNKLVRAYDATITGLAALAGIIVGTACAMIVVDVSVRALGFQPPAYTIAIVEYMLLYITMFAGPYLVRERGHVYIDALISRVPLLLEKIFAKLTYMIAIAASLLVTVLSSQLFWDAVRTGLYDEQGVDMPFWSLYLPIPIGFGLMVIEFARYLFGSQFMHRSKSNVDGSV